MLRLIRETTNNLDCIWRCNNDNSTAENLTKNCPDNITDLATEAAFYFQSVLIAGITMFDLTIEMFPMQHLKTQFRSPNIFTLSKLNATNRRLKISEHSDSLPLVHCIHCHMMEN